MEKTINLNDYEQIIYPSVDRNIDIYDNSDTNTGKFTKQLISMVKEDIKRRYKLAKKKMEIQNTNNKLFTQIKEMLGGKIPDRVLSLSLHLELDSPPQVECRYYIDDVSNIESIKKFNIVELDNNDCA